MPADYLSVSAAAAAADVSGETVRRYVRRGLIQPLGRIGTGYLIDPADVPTIRRLSKRRGGWPAGKPVPRDVVRRRIASRKSSAGKNQGSAGKM